MKKTFILDNNIINCEEHVKLLVLPLIINCVLIFIISNVCKKASRQLNVLKRNTKKLCRLGKLNIYYTLIMLKFIYCPLVWHFCGEVSTKKIVKFRKGSSDLYIKFTVLAMILCLVDLYYIH